MSFLYLRFYTPLLRYAPYLQKSAAFLSVTNLSVCPCTL